LRPDLIREHPTEKKLGEDSPNEREKEVEGLTIGWLVAATRAQESNSQAASEFGRRVVHGGVNQAHNSQLNAGPKGGRKKGHKKRAEHRKA